jgi:hypothetical protein
VKFVITDLSIETLPEAPTSQGEGEFAAPGSPQPCWTTSSTCWCTCSGCTTLTHPHTANYTEKLSELADLEERLTRSLAEVQRRSALLTAERARLEEEAD